MTWLIAGLAGLAGLFYGLWQHSRANRFEADSKRFESALAVEKLDRDTDIRVREAVIASLKADVTRLEEASLANATPDELRARLDAVLRPQPT